MKDYTKQRLTISVYPETKTKLAFLSNNFSAWVREKVSVEYDKLIASVTETEKKKNV